MEDSLNLIYDHEGDILHLDKVKPYKEQESEELGEGIIARFNPQTNEIENLEVLFFSSRLMRSNTVNLPLKARFEAVER